MHQPSRSLLAFGQPCPKLEPHTLISAFCKLQASASHDQFLSYKIHIERSTARTTTLSVPNAGWHDWSITELEIYNRAQVTAYPGRINLILTQIEVCGLLSTSPRVSTIILISRSSDLTESLDFSSAGEAGLSAG